MMCDTWRGLLLLAKDAEAFGKLMREDTGCTSSADKQRVFFLSLAASSTLSAVFMLLER